MQLPSWLVWCRASTEKTIDAGCVVNALPNTLWDLVANMLGGSAVSSGTEARHRIVQAARKLHDLAASCFGPRGNFVAVRNESAHSKMTVTSSSGQVYRHVKLPSSVLTVQLLKDNINTLDRNYGDGGHFCVLLATELVLTVLGDISHSKFSSTDAFASIPRRVIVAGHNLAMKWTIEFLQSAACPIRADLSWDEPKQICALLRTSLLTKSVCGLNKRYKFSPDGEAQEVDEAAALSNLILQAFLNSLSIDDASQTLVPNVHVMNAPSTAAQFDLNLRTTASRSQSSDSSSHTLLCNSVMLDVPVPPDIERAVATLHQRLNARTQAKNSSIGGPLPAFVVLYNVSLRTPDLNKDSGIVVNSSRKDGAAGWSAEAVERTVLQRIADNLIALGVSVVASQRLIHPWLKAVLLQRGIVPVERLSLRHVGLFRCITGCSVIGEWSQKVRAQDLGALRDITVWRATRTKTLLSVDGFSTEAVRTAKQLQQRAAQSSAMTVQVTWSIKALPKTWALHPWAERRRDVSLILLRGQNEISMTELEYSVRRCVTMLTNLVESPGVVAGGGACELQVADFIRTKGRELVASAMASRPHAPSSTTAPLFATVKSTQRHLQYVLNNFADCVEAVAWKLCHANQSGVSARASFTAIPTLTRSSLHSDEKQIWGWDSDQQGPTVVMVVRDAVEQSRTDTTSATPRNIVSVSHVDMLAPKIAALKMAVGSANTLLKVATIISSARD